MNKNAKKNPLPQAKTESYPGIFGGQQSEIHFSTATGLGHNPVTLPINAHPVRMDTFCPVSKVRIDRDAIIAFFRNWLVGGNLTGLSEAASKSFRDRFG